MKTSTATSVAVAFIITYLTPINMAPTGVYFTTIQTELNSNNMNIASTASLSNGHLVLNPVAYTTYGSNTFPAPST